jgi:WS/DGAT/MGAT family acyltransferase
MTGLEAMFVRMDRRSAYQHTLKVAILAPSGDPDGWSFDRYRRALEHQLRVVPILRQRYVETPLGLHRPVWVDDPDFDLDVHMRRIACPSPGGMAEFCRVVEQVYCHPLDHRRPLWQVWVVEGLEGGRVAILALVHHAYSDGAGMRAIVEATTSSEPGDLPSEAGGGFVSPPLPSALRRTAWAVRDLPELARELVPTVRLVRERVRLEREHAARGSDDRPTAKDKRQPQRFGGPLGRGRKFACGSVSLEEMRQVRAALGGSINDVFLACVAGSVRSFLTGQRVECSAPLVATMPLGMKSAAERDFLGGNFSSVDDIWLHAEIADPVERYAATRASAQATKDHFSMVSKADPLSLIDFIPSPVLSAALLLDERTGGRFTPASNVLVSNVRGPEEPRYIGRWQLERWFSTGQVLHGATLNFTGWSYVGEFNVCVLANSSQVSDPWPLLEQFRASLQELLGCARKTA